MIYPMIADFFRIRAAKCQWEAFLTVVAGEKVLSTKPTRKALRVKSSRAGTRVLNHRTQTIQFSDERRLTSYAGLAIFQGFFTTIAPKGRLRSCFRHLHEQAIFDL